MKAALARAFVLAPGILPLSLLYGIAAGGAGFTAAQVFLMSGFGFAGTAQFAAINLANAGAGFLAAAGTTFVINSRYLLMTTGTLQLVQHRRAPAWKRIWLSLLVVDENYALQQQWAEQGKPRTWDLILLGSTIWVIWMTGSLAGLLVGDRLPDLMAIGLDYALPGLFVGLLGIFAKDREHAALGLACLALGGVLALVGQAVLATVLVPVVAAIGWGRWRTP